ncbi:MAG TPA: 4-hydroxy-tetrahydrodipicolinate synthase [Anaerohalosphaeraceae bacterium]|nr:4-hydroxy-tetrahydrodipicolinate synthase [Phycisphaerae bacterium]HOK95936.1 4-hydroxy-tetrahydrodipicolinate synthase [Anaerohalosphaeraceae bacterium]HOL30628.1 4-hydroxy-tetrahydrodipicolinate synthase [Anaerohalosphaeraceae bacterium]HOM75293.1 4-hydroxy-tetrahydrodipicolinate synthase [Anaerohalosphaeraceae bacterium]HPC63107.1 4-hydroxy-tetrahydrodipicolinate synthase [Anaerohalosphaeraceae bacterium]
MFSGALVAIITPFSEGQVDFETLTELVEFQLESGIDGIVPVGTTGESPTLSYDEHKRVIEHVVKTVGRQVPVIAGTGSNSTAEAIELTEFARKVGADASLQVAPYYNKPMQEGFYQHFKAIAEEVDLPMVLYNIPGRCGGTGLTAETVARLAEVDNIVAIKEATGSMDMASEIASRCDITILSGDDSLTLPLAAIGAKGVISVVANIVPADVKAMTDLILEGDFVSARKWHRKLFPLSKTMLSLATNPIPVKAALAMLNMASEELRLPMTVLEEAKKAQLRQLLKDYGLLD